AAWMTGMERNADLVIMSCYAPLFVNVNTATATAPKAWQWKSDLIGYDALSSYGSPSYYVQKLFSQYLGDEVVPLDARDLPTQVKKPNSRDSARGVAARTIPAMFFSATRDSHTGAIYLKVVNATGVAQNVQLELTGKEKVVQEGKTFTIGSDDPEATNSISEPQKVVPVSGSLKGVGNRFRHSFPAYSVTILQMLMKQN